MKRAVLLSILDQALMSAFSLALNLAFISWATPEDFGRFVLVMAGGFFPMSSQNALVLMPLNYLIPGRPPKEAQAQLSMIISVNMVLTLLISAAGTVSGLLVGADTTLYVCIALWFVTLLMREFSRSTLIVNGQVGQVLLQDVVTVAVSVLAVLALWQVMRPEAAALGGIAAGNLAVLLTNRTGLDVSWRLMPEHLVAYRIVWRETRWALQGALQNEVEARSYVLMVERWRDAATLGMIQAGRVAISPLLLISNAWRRVARPKIVEALHLGHYGGASRILWSGAAIVTVATLLYGLVLVLAWPLLETFVFRQRYGDMQTIVLCWWIYSGIVGLASVAATLLEARRQFRTLAATGFAIAVLILVLLGGLVFTDLDVATVVVILAGVHLLELVIYCVMISRHPLHSPETELRAEKGG